MPKKKRIDRDYLPPFLKNPKNPPPDYIQQHRYVSILDLWKNIFLRCDSETLDSLTLVCKQFCVILYDNRFWLQKCIHDRVSIPPKKWRDFILNDTDKSFNYHTIYENNPYNRNLAFTISETDTIASLQKKYSRKFRLAFHSAGNGMTVEAAKDLRFQDPRVKVCLATSYQRCSRQLVVNLEQLGVQTWILDHIRPNIVVRELVSCRDDCSATYTGCTSLYKERQLRRPYPGQGCKFTEQTIRWPQWAGGRCWEEVVFKYDNYPIGCRAVFIKSEGYDNQFWAGHYGAKFANLEVIVTFPEECRLLGVEDFPDSDASSETSVESSSVSMVSEVESFVSEDPSTDEADLDYQIDDEDEDEEDSDMS